jgi:hypothetical protein
MGVSQPGRAVEYFLHGLADKSSRGCIGRCTTWEEINRLMVSLGAIFSPVMVRVSFLTKRLCCETGFA